MYAVCLLIAQGLPVPSTPKFTRMTEYHPGNIGGSVST